MSKETDLYPWRKTLKTFPKPIKDSIVNVIKMGHIPKLSSLREKMRKQLGVDPTPPTVYRFKNSLLEFQSLIKWTRLDLKVGWNWKRGKSKD